MSSKWSGGISPENRAQAEAEDRQRALSEVCQRTLKDFVGRKATRYVVVEAEGMLRRALDEAVRAGTYVLPEGLVLDRVELSADMRIQVFFGRSKPLDFVLLQPACSEEPVETRMRDRFDAVAAEIEADLRTK